jgi:hypothetical protein
MGSMKVGAAPDGFAPVAKPANVDGGIEESDSTR